MPKNAPYAMFTYNFLFSACVNVRTKLPFFVTHEKQSKCVLAWNISCTSMILFRLKNNRPANHLRSTVIFFIHGGKNYTQALTVWNSIANLNVKHWAQSRMTVLKIRTTAEISSTGSFFMEKDLNYSSIAELKTFTSIYIPKDWKEKRRIGTYIPDFNWQIKSSNNL